MSAEMIIHSGETVALDRSHPVVSALAIEDGLVSVVGTAEDVEHSRGAETQDIDLGGATVIPGLNDSHLHLIRGGLNYLVELRWEGVPSLSDALVMLKEQADRTPAPQWVRVIGGWSEFQFAERRLPTLAEINAVSPHTPVLVLHLYARALLNQAALRTAGRGSAFRAADWGPGTAWSRLGWVAPSRPSVNLHLRRASTWRHTVSTAWPWTRSGHSRAAEPLAGACRAENEAP